MVPYTPRWVTQHLFLSFWGALGPSLAHWPLAPGSKSLSGHLTHLGYPTHQVQSSPYLVLPLQVLCTFLCLPHPFYKVLGSFHLPWILSICHEAQHLGIPLSVLPFLLCHFGSFRTSQVSDFILSSHSQAQSLCHLSS